MDNQKALQVLKTFYIGSCEDMVQISRRTKVSRDEVREVLKGARECGLIDYHTNGFRETFNNIKKKKLETYLRAKGALK